MTEAELEFRQQWSLCAGETKAMREAEEAIRRKAADAFYVGNDKAANALRAIADEFKAKHAKLSAELQTFIDRSNQ